MRGNHFHNMLAQRAKTVFIRLNWCVYTEHGIRINNAKYYFDLFAVKDSHAVACEIETTCRHVIENAAKAQTGGIRLWFIVPTLKVKEQALIKLKRLKISPDSKFVRVLLLGLLEQEIADCFEKH